jgi:CubicO group peptidase (beta-lactamase class C family)
MRKYLFVFSCILSTSLFAQKNNAAEEKRFAGLDTAFSRVLKDWHCAGFSVAVVEKNKVIYSRGFGYKDNSQKIPATGNTLYAIGSCTKAFTASMLGMLRKDGKIDFDLPVTNYLPDLKFFKDEMNNQITLRDMMSHRTGLPRHDLSWYFFSTDSRDSLMKRIQYMEPSAGLREKWQYNNFMFLLQGILEEKVTGQSWENNLQAKIFEPLHMIHTNSSIEALMKNPESAIGYDVKNDSVIKKLDYYRIGAMGPAGSINSSVNDMANWVITWINGGKFEGKEIIPENYVQEAMSSQMIIGAGLPDKEIKDIFFANYGFGWFLDSYRGHYRVEHGGNIDGFSANTSFFPSDSIGIVVLCNQNGSAVPSIVRNLIADRILKLKYSDWDSYLKRRADEGRKTEKEAKKMIVKDEKPSGHPSHPLTDYSGFFSNKGYGTIEVRLERDSLFAYVGKHVWWLKHKNYDVFISLEKDPADGIDTSEQNTPIDFRMNMAGEIDGIGTNFEPTLKPIVFSRVPAVKIMSKDSLLQYTGEYLLGNIALKISLKNGSTLTLVVPGQPEYELVPRESDKFGLKALEGFSIVFNRNEKNEIIELLSIQPNGTFKAIRKK